MDQALHGRPRAPLRHQRGASPTAPAATAKQGHGQGHDSSLSASTHCTLKPPCHARSWLLELSRSMSLSVNPSLVFGSPGRAPVCGGCRPIFRAELCQMGKGTQQTGAKCSAATQASTGKTPAGEKILKARNKGRMLQGSPRAPCPLLPRACWASKGSTNI